MNTFDTIAAVATGGGISAIGIVRVSGEKALTAADNIFKAANGIKLKDAHDRQMYYGELINAGGELVDLCLCFVSRAPRSYTGEDTVEFHCHGSPVVLAEALKALFASGARQAQAGEFTKRAFLNGRMDLTQAEAVIDLIEAETPGAARNAAGQLNGAVYAKMNAIYDRLVDVMAHFHAVVDYPDEDIDAFDIQNYLAALRESESELRRLLATHERGNLLRTGIPTAIVGRTNVGKSSLFNALLGFERAIVTDIAGTTRDTIDEKVLVGNILLRLTDTAGLRETDDTVEKLGVERSLAALEGAKLVLAVFDGSLELQEDDYKVLEAVSGVSADVPVIIVINKSDIFFGDSPQIVKLVKEVGCHFDNQPPGTQGDGSLVSSRNNNTGEPSPCVTSPCVLSAKTGEGISGLCNAIQKLFPDFDDAPAGEIITSVRQAEAIGRAADGMERAIKALTAKVSADAVLTDIEAGLEAIGEVTGKTMREDIVSRIFERFCVGK